MKLKRFQQLGVNTTAVGFESGTSIFNMSYSPKVDAHYLRREVPGLELFYSTDYEAWISIETWTSPAGMSEANRRLEGGFYQPSDISNYHFYTDNSNNGIVRSSTNPAAGFSASLSITPNGRNV